MNYFGLPPVLFFLECALITLSFLSGGIAILLIRAARRPLDSPSKISHNMPSTPLTRGKPRKVRRELSQV